MSERDAGDDRTHYRELIRLRPELFADSTRGGIRILLVEDEIRRVEHLVAERLSEQGLPPAWSRVGVVYEDPYIMVLRDAVRFPDGHESTYVRVLPRNGGATGGVAVLASIGGKLVLLRHFRHATRTLHLEIPRGFLDRGDSTESCVRAELLEEIGGVVATLEPLGCVHTDSGLLASSVDLFHAQLTLIGRPEAREAIDELVLVDVRELERLIVDGEITDSFTIAAFARARLRGLV